MTLKELNYNYLICTKGCKNLELMLTLSFVGGIISLNLLIYFLF